MKGFDLNPLYIPSMLLLPENLKGTIISTVTSFR